MYRLFTNKDYHVIDNMVSEIWESTTLSNVSVSTSLVNEVNRSVYQNSSYLFSEIDFRNI